MRLFSGLAGLLPLPALFCLLLACPPASLGQSNNLGATGNSPFSRLGIGEGLAEGSTRQQAMGSSGSALGSPEAVNMINPALLHYSRVVNLETAVRTAVHLASDGQGNRLQSGRYAPLFLAITLPVSQALTLSVGLRQVSSLDYNVASTGKFIAGSDTILNRSLYQGNGALSTAYLAGGVRLPYGFSVGASVQYYFGTLSRLSFAEVPGYVLEQRSRSRVQDLSVRPGIAWRGPVGRYRLSLAATADLATKLNTTDAIYATRYRQTSAGLAQGGIDTLQNERAGTLQLPQTLHLGVGWEFVNHFALAADVVAQDWTKTAGLAVTGGSLGKTMRYSAGVEWMPDYNSTSYFRRMLYRAGVAYKQLPGRVDDKQPQDLSLTLGLGWPILRKEARYTRPALNTNVQLGRRYLAGGGGVRETFINFTLGVVLNDSQWFVRYKID